MKLIESEKIDGKIIDIYSDEALGDKTYGLDLISRINKIERILIMSVNVVYEDKESIKMDGIFGGVNDINDFLHRNVSFNILSIEIEGVLRGVSFYLGVDIEIGTIKLIYDEDVFFNTSIMEIRNVIEEKM